MKYLLLLLALIISALTPFSINAQTSTFKSLLTKKNYVFFMADDLFFSCQNTAVNLSSLTIKEKEPNARTIMVVDFDDDSEVALIEYAKNNYMVDTIIADLNDEIRSYYYIVNYPTYLELDSHGVEIRRYDGMHFEIVTETAKLLDSIAHSQQYSSVFINESIPLSRANDAKIDKNTLYVTDSKLGSIAQISLHDGKINQFSTPDVSSMRTLYSNQSILDTNTVLKQIKKGMIFFPKFNEIICDKDGVPKFVNADYIKEITTTTLGSINSLSPTYENVLIPIHSDFPFSQITEVNPIFYRETNLGVSTLLNSSSLLTETRIKKGSKSLKGDMLFAQLDLKSGNLKPIITKEMYRMAMNTDWKTDYISQALVARSSSEALYCSMAQNCLLSVKISDKPILSKITAQGELGSYFNSVKIWKKKKTLIAEQYSMALAGMIVVDNRLYMGFTQSPAVEFKEDLPANKVIFQSYNLDSGKFKEWDLTPLLVNDALLQVRFAGIEHNQAVFLYKWSVKRWEIRKIPLQILE